MYREIGNHYENETGICISVDAEKYYQMKEDYEREKEELFIEKINLEEELDEIKRILSLELSDQMKITSLKEHFKDKEK